MIMSVPLMIRFSGGRSDVGKSWLNDIRFSNAFCFQNLFLFGTHVLSMSINPRNMGTCKEDLTTTNLELIFEVSKNMTSKDSIDFARDCGQYMIKYISGEVECHMN